MGCCGSSFVPHPNPDPVDYSRLHGRYWMVSTCLDMWKPSERICPAMLWEPMDRDSKGRLRISDVTEYRTGTLDKPSELKYFDGYDTNTSEQPDQWEWRGSGCLSLMTSDFQIIRHAEDYRWAIVAYGKTCASIAGLDIYHRDPVPPPEEMAALEKIIADDPYLKAKAGDRLFRTVQDPKWKPTTAGVVHVNAAAGSS